MILDLKGEWTLTINNKVYPAIVPGANYLDLMASGALDDPFYGENEQKSKWVGEHDSLYIKEFEPTSETLKQPYIELVCSGVDTVCEISLNGVKVADTDNAFRVYRFDIKEHLRKGKNTLEFLFRSPVEWVRAANAKEPLAKNFMGQTGIQHLRKPAYHFGWDWGPVLPFSGICGDIYIQGYAARLKDVKIVQKHQDGAVFVRTEAEQEGKAEQEGGIDCSVALKITSQDGALIYSGTAAGTATGKTAVFEAVIEQPELWYPNGLGAQPLYNFEIILISNEKELDKKSYKIGLRELTLDTSADSFGSNFCFYVNGKKLFAKGANWIPSDSFPTRTSLQTLEFYIKSAAEANMNMLRVWGGGYYESDSFYDLCDRYGILVWQDFCYACYPAPFYNENFVENALIEALENVKRLSRHASLCLFCGNNEIESTAAIWGHRLKLKKAQKTFFYETLKNLALGEAVPYWAGSPTSGEFLKDTGSDDRGDTHLWQVWHGLRRPEYYRRRQSRFISEFGLEALPTMHAIKSFAKEEDMRISSPVMKVHQKCVGGNGKMLYYLMLDYPLPQSFPELVYLSGLTQAYAVKKAALSWRKAAERTNGVLFWQYNDCWPVSSWSAIDYTDSFKALYYFSKRFFAPITLYLEKSRGKIKVIGINDTDKAFVGKTRITTLTFKGEVIAEEIRQVSLDACAATEIYVACKTHNIKKSTYILAELIDESGRVIAVERELLTKDKAAAYILPKFKTTVEVDGRTARITVKTDVFARNVFVDIQGIPSQFDKNYIDIDAGCSAVFTIELPTPLTKAELSNRLDIRCVNTIKGGAKIKALLARFAVILYPPNLINAIAQLFN